MEEDHQRRTTRTEGPPTPLHSWGDYDVPQDVVNSGTNNGNSTGTEANETNIDEEFAKSGSIQIVASRRNTQRQQSGKGNDGDSLYEVIPDESGTRADMPLPTPPRRETMRDPSRSPHAQPYPSGRGQRRSVVSTTEEGYLAPASLASSTSSELLLRSGGDRGQKQVLQRPMISNETYEGDSFDAIVGSDSGRVIGSKGKSTQDHTVSPLVVHRPSSNTRMCLIVIVCLLCLGVGLVAGLFIQLNTSSSDSGGNSGASSSSTGTSGNATVSREDLASLMGEVSMLRAQLSQQDMSITALQSRADDADALESLLSGQDSAISSLQSHASTVSAAVSTNKADAGNAVLSVAMRLSSQERDTSMSVSDLGSMISQLTMTDGRLSSALTAIDGNVTSLSSALAQIPRETDSHLNGTSNAARGGISPSDPDFAFPVWHDLIVCWATRPSLFSTSLLASVADAFETKAIDFDGDGDIDIVAAADDDNLVVWHENLFADTGVFGSFNQHIISATVDGPRSLGVADIDNDGDYDVVVGSAGDTAVRWFENVDGNGRTFQRHSISLEADYPHGMSLGDLDGDGDVDVVVALFNDNHFYWYESKASVGTPDKWTAHLIAIRESASSVAVADLDGDGDLDVVAAAASDTFLWYENTNGDASSFTIRIISTTFDNPLSVEVSDIDGDGDLDIVGASSRDDSITWFENFDGSAGSFSTHTIFTRADYTTFATAIDFDGDGDMDIVSTSRDDNTVRWHENVHGNAGTFTTYVITSSLDSSVDASLADLDNDGDIDMVVSAYASGGFWIIENSCGRQNT